MKVIINADDFGIDIDRDFGILWGVIRGCISSVSVVVTNRIGLLRKFMIKIMKIKASIGIHINLTDDNLVNYEVKDICYSCYHYKKAKYSFWRNAIEDTINVDKVEQEIKCQIDRFYTNYNFFPEHIDGHNHCNIFNKKIEAIFEKISLEYKIHLRIPYENLDLLDKRIISNNNFFYEFYKFTEDKIDDEVLKKNYDYFFKYDMYLNNYMCVKNCKKDNIKYIGTMYGYFRGLDILWNQLIRFKKKDVIQIMTHPGFYWKFVNHKTIFSNNDRVKELKVLKDLKAKLKENNIECVNYKEIK